MRNRSFVLNTAALSICSVIALTASPAFADSPLLQEGKHTVFERVVSHPKAILYALPSASSAIAAMPRSFTSYYVYERKNGMLRVGVSSDKSDGWLKDSDATLWPQAVTMVFTDQMGREPVLFFRNHKEVVKACEADSIRDYLLRLNDDLVLDKRLAENSPVIAAEPMGETGQVAANRFYLLPVLNIDSQFRESGAELLEVACIDPGMTPQQAPGEKAPAPERMTTGLAFVIDTTISMGPYIKQTVKLIRDVYDELQKSPAKDDLAIAVVAFRSNLEKSPGIEYTTKVISDFRNVRNRADLEKVLSRVREAAASTHAFDEDSFAGVKEAADSLSWSKYSAKAMLLLTDAGPLAEGDPTSKTGMSAEGMADYLRTNNIYLTAVHIKSPAGRRDHAYAEKNYKTLSAMSNNRSSYIAIDAGTPQSGAAEFEKVGSQIATVYRKVLESNSRGELAPKPEAKPVAKNETPEEQARRIAEATGYAMQLQFLGEKNRTAAPQVKKAWIADTDLSALEANPDDAPVPAVYPAVLLTKTQLSQLRKQLKMIIQTAEEAFLQDSAGFNFYEQLVSAAAQMSRDPTQFNKDPSANLAQKGVLLEVLDGLPYKSRVLGMQKDDWVNMSTGDQQAFIKRLKGLIARYDEYDRDSTHWEGFGSPNANDWVYRVPLNMLP